MVRFGNRETYASQPSALNPGAIGRILNLAQFWSNVTPFRMNTYEKQGEGTVIVSQTAVLGSYRAQT